MKTSIFVFLLSCLFMTSCSTLNYTLPPYYTYDIKYAVHYADTTKIVSTNVAKGQNLCAGSINGTNYICYDFGYKIFYVYSSSAPFEVISVT